MFNKQSFTLEVLNSLLKAQELSNFQIIEPLHILGSLFLTDNLVSNLLQINNNIKNNTIINFINTYYKSNNTYNNTLLKFSSVSLKLISNLLKLTTIINTLDLFNICLCYNTVISKIFLCKLNIFNINYIKNLYFKQPLLILKSFSKYFLYNNKSYIIGRYSEIQSILLILSNKLIRNPILIGDDGIGKFSIIKGVFLNFKNNKFIKNKSNSKFYFFDINKLIDIYTSDTFIDNKIKLSNWILINENSLFIIKNLDNFYNLHEDFCIKFIETLEPLIIKKKLQIIISSSNNKKFLNYLKTYIERILLLDIINIKEPNRTDNLNILKLKSLEISKYHNIIIPLKFIPQLIKITHTHIKNKVFPSKGIIILDKACSLQNIYELSINSYLKLKYIKESISKICDIPFVLIDKTLHKENNIKNLEILLKQRIFGQNFVINKISNSIKRALAGIKSPTKPIGSWLLCGPSGTGKTELAKSLSEILFGSNTDLIRFDMSEYIEKHSISKLIGSPPGYIGYGDKGLLTDAVDKTPYSIVLFDEIEKAHISISNIMLQILDDGRLTDSTGKITDFSNTIIIFTSNLGCPKELTEFNIVKNSTNNLEYRLNETKIHTSIKNYFKPEFINRLQDILIFQPLNETILITIIDKFLKQFILQLKELQIPVTIIIEETFKLFISKLSTSPIYGARPLKRLLDELIADPIIEILIKLELNTQVYCLYTLIPETNTISYSIIPISNANII